MKSLEASSFEKSESTNEQDFGQLYLRNDVKRATLCILLLSPLFLLSFFSDYQLFLSGLTFEFYSLAALRSGLVLYGIFLFVHLRRVKQYGSYEKLAFSYALFVTALTLFNSVVRPQGNIASEFIGLMLIVFIFYLVIPFRFVYQTFSVLVLIAGKMLTYVIVGALDVSTLIGALLIIAIALVVAASSSWQLHEYRKQGFLEITERKKAEEAVRKSEERWATTLASVGDSVISSDATGKITFMNAIAEKLTGWTLSEALKKPVKEVFKIINEHTRLEVEDPVAKVLEKGMIIGLANHTILVRKDKTEVPIDDSGAPIKDKDGKTTGVVLVFRDISERKKAEQEIWQAKNDWERTFNSVPDLIAILDNEHRILRANKAMADVLGCVPEKCVGLHCYVSVHGTNSPPDFCPHMKTLKDAQEHIEEVYEERLGGDFLVSTTPLLDDQGLMIGSVHVARNITERKMMEKKLEEYAKHLEDLVNERTKELKNSERMAAIGATAGMVGHDIRNPLQAITSDAYLAKTELAAIPECDGKKNALESLEEIEKNADYINKIVADLQDFARPLDPHVEEVDLRLMIDEMLKKNNFPNNVKISVKISDVSKVVTDSTFISRILYNLVNNAVQAMPKGGKLTIHAYKKVSDVIISVKDTGIGIQEKNRDKMFTPMFTTKAKGQGFGLVVVKRMTEALGGTVSFESIEGRGATFTVRFPLSKS